ncbi:orotidine-5'-phosphate decarboxylase [Hymenobacter lutimineralis]|uniref:Orotidine-5'-phosphate decarboxylase n=1 Tax=Hymenobacter lutimineralis TaxID=2606448 RepID=A0A5D6VBM8_9BACT|nr:MULTISPECIES: orotidine-5'-phosphate decarboxylase [Hymenobacter]QIX61812.1 orotidine-5'-phosphate decarboxylase [Hymenobacter sp. BT18]TYZ12740.1 orotidine-5'-phosphate decarboxylase [Hymenobacter lutimineralis]
MQKLIQRTETANTLLCVGLDPVGDDAQVARRLAEVIDQTSEYAAAFKPNLAFFLSRENGVQLLKETVQRIPKDIPVILDGKFGDIANTADHYARFAYDVVGADGVTVNPYMGDDAVRPFVRENKLVFVLAKTSNKSQYSMQDMALTRGGSLADGVAKVASRLDSEIGGIGLVVGATNAEAVGRLRTLCPGLWFLVPGVGAQGGDLQATLKAGLRPNGSGLLINTSRVLWQAADAGATARELVAQINQFRAVPA